MRETYPMSSGVLGVQGLPQSYRHLCQCLPQSGHAEGGRKIRRKCLIPQGPHRGRFRLLWPHPREAANNSGVRGIAGEGRAVPDGVGCMLVLSSPTGPSSPQMLLGHPRFKFWLCLQLAACLWNKPFDHSGFQLPHQ